MAYVDDFGNEIQAYTTGLPPGAFPEGCQRD